MVELKTYNGLIRNHVELATELGVDITCCTRCEREERLILAAWEAWGTDMGNHINGQFAFALYDPETDFLFAARDILGAELLFYYMTEDGKLLVSTQITDLFDQPGFKRELNEEMVQFFLEFTYVPGEDTLFKGVHKLVPGGYLTFDKNGLKLGTYWELSFEPDDSKSLDEWATDIEKAMEESVASILDEGEVVDSFLSGGVDSSYIMAKSPAQTGYCVSYEDQNTSEESQARATAEFLGRNFEGIKVTQEDFFSSVDEFLLAYEQPSSDVAGLALFIAAKKLAKKSKLCFSGEGADEFFAGYGVYQRVNRIRMSPDPVYLGSTHIMNNSEMRRYLKRFYSNIDAKKFMKERCAKAKDYDPLNWMLYSELRSYFEGSILFNSTRIARGTGLDIRMPYCDLRMFDIARRMPPEFKATKGKNKIALRAAASRVLPLEVAYRKKLGFPVPVRAWLKDPAVNADIRRAFESEAAAKFFKVDEIGALLDVFLGQKPRKQHPVWFKRHQALLWRHVWTIYIFIRWYELFFEDETTACPRCLIGQLDNCSSCDPASRDGGDNNHQPTITPYDEYIDIYDENRNPLGKTIPREGAFLKEGEFMLYVLAIVQNSEGKYLITQRSFDKHWAGGSWEITGGGVLTGETSAQAVVREVREEVGLDVSDQPLEPVYSYANVDLERGDNYIVDFYRFTLDITPEDVTLQDSEAIDCTFATWDEICELANQGKFLHFNRLKQALE